MYENEKTIFPNSNGNSPNICFGYAYNGIGSSGSAANSLYSLYLNDNKIATVSENGIHAARGKMINSGANLIPIYGTQSSPGILDFSSNLQRASTIINLTVFTEKAYYVLPSGQDQDLATFMVVNGLGINVSKIPPNQMYLNGELVTDSIDLLDIGTFLECRFVSNVWYCKAHGRVSF